MVEPAGNKEEKMLNYDIGIALGKKKNNIGVALGKKKNNNGIAVGKKRNIGITRGKINLTTLELRLES